MLFPTKAFHTQDLLYMPISDASTRKLGQLPVRIRDDCVEERMRYRDTLLIDFVLNAATEYSSSKNLSSIIESLAQ
jgi:hypothetical protein